MVKPHRYNGKTAINFKLKYFAVITEESTHKHESYQIDVLDYLINDIASQFSNIFIFFIY